MHVYINIEIKPAHAACNCTRNYTYHTLRMQLIGKHFHTLLEIFKIIIGKQILLKSSCYNFTPVQLYVQHNI